MSELPPWFDWFCDLSSDRLAVLVRVLHTAQIPFELLKIEGFRHLQVRGTRPERPLPGEKILIAHYDRVAGTPGANDNGASVLALVDYLRRADQPLRVVFTDGEELGTGDSPTAQGSFALARFWGTISPLFPVVLDMTGIGDTVVLGHLAESLMRRVRPEVTPTDLDESARLRLTALRWLSGCGAGDTLEIDTPFSDDLGLFLAGIPAVQLSLLPRREALAYRKDPEKRLPPAWSSMHTPLDRPEFLTGHSRKLVAQILDRLQDFPVG